MLQESAMILYNLFNLPIITLFPYLTTPTYIKHTNTPDTNGTHILSHLYVYTLLFLKISSHSFWILVSVEITGCKDNRTPDTGKIRVCD